MLSSASSDVQDQMSISEKQYFDYGDLDLRAKTVVNFMASVLERESFNPGRKELSEDALAEMEPMRYATSPQSTAGATEVVPAAGIDRDEQELPEKEVDLGQNTELKKFRTYPTVEISAGIFLILQTILQLTCLSS